MRVNATEIVTTAATGRVSLANSGGELLTGALFSTVTAGGDITLSQSSRQMRLGAINANSGTGTWGR